MRKPSPALLLGLFGAVGLWLWSRTTGGHDMVGKVISTGADAVRAITGPRGIRNNNPGNIDRTADRWRGMSLDQSGDARFVVFDSPVWGLRALARILRTYASNGADTIAEVIARWAPSTENNTAAYVAAVSRAVGVAPDVKLTDAELPAVIKAIVQHENGQQPYSDALIAQAIALERSA